MLSRACALAALLSIVTAGTAEAALGDRVLKRGSHGEDVRELQRNLSRLGFVATADGAFGPQTRAAVLAYEQDVAITEDGRVSRKQGRGIARRAGAQPQIDPTATTSGDTAVLASDGRTALAPESAPQPVKDAIAAANRITDKSYRYGGGHGTFNDTGYDCSGAVSYVLHGAGVLRTPRDSTGFMSYARAGRGDWISVYANAGHAYVVIAGLRFDTSGSGEKGPRWRPEPRSGRTYVVRHPPNL